ncbi:UNVERIFIED_ORG: hypothetical protein QE446_004956 [Rhizobium sp. SORGH_AS260]|nr:hypothetical protein [Rhizobium sp. SORGH_AS_0285]MDP9757032.1 hypothetical protein [Rhizobium sp. SORGH_AS_0260]MDR6083719.1 hypothetical protein [Agrobacterium sp. SORGH_AS_0440]
MDRLYTLMKPFPVLLQRILGVSSHPGKLVVIVGRFKRCKLSLCRRRARAAKATNRSGTSYNRVASRFSPSALRWQFSLVNSSRMRFLAARSKLLHEAETILMKEQPVAPLLTQADLWLVSNRVKGWVDNAANQHLSRFLSVSE